ncbi:unnamed protein product [Fraxinus pennsylvanica]|uniref:Uncharacterized protein n=1 Tax=Fraxinus pennsylvanica TaxID=56036 RepID=A0AAD1YX31_9LAMI|nr:unnamed protein product [Fraxinus pennsylvanica]
MFDLHMLLKRGKIAIDNLLLHHHHHYYAALTCRSNDVNMSFVTPREYEFSCSNTLVYHSKSKNRHQRRHDRVEKINVVVFDMLNHYDAVELSPLTTLPGFGVSPVVRQLRVTDSPFSLKDTEEYNYQVDKDAEEFIKKFYKDLKNEKRIAALESPSPNHIRARMKI